MFIPNIDFSIYDQNNPQALQTLADQVSGALSDSGFMSISNIGLSSELRDQAFAQAKAYFAQSMAEKNRCAYISAQENFGYQAILKEHLDPDKPADLKESFTMRDAMKHQHSDARWPSSEFKNTFLAFYQGALNAAHRVQRVFAKALRTECEFFVERHTGSSVTLRALHYPAVGYEREDVEQLGAGAHTDYGMITLLFQDGVTGLELQDRDGVWHPVAADKDKILINTGDLMQRWTNGRFRSTPHRVQPKIGDRERYSIAMFVDPDEAVMIETLPSCISAENPQVDPPITAGEHILQKIQATHRKGYY